ncbi:hypothetical protein E2C01_087378 [Portunus trituberculatus]|uniref:Uncharacterized protein n=1 Tax=Portunus trituberculatus TaxID=210409 RepID=A0A5B7JH34_PORTR|nr:hypothetical protein [Portunus trituberculatus]
MYLQLKPFETSGEGRKTGSDYGVRGETRRVWQRDGTVAPMVVDDHNDVSAEALHGTWVTSNVRCGPQRTP